MIPLRRDFEALGKLLKQLDNDTFTWPSDPYPSPDYKVIHTIQDLDSYISTCDHYYEIANDTETHSQGIPHCLTFSHTPGTARLIYASNQRVLNEYANYLQHFRPLQLYYNYLYDLKPMNEMGITIPPTRFLDIMIRAYELGLGGGGDDDDTGAARGSLGLKTLAYRHLHMHMTSFRDTVYPYTLPLILDHLYQVSDLVSPAEHKETCECGHSQEAHQKKGKTQRRIGWCEKDGCECEKWKKVSKPKQSKELGSFYRKVNYLADQLLRGKQIDPWARVKEWHGWEKEMMEEFAGRMPVLDIRLVPENVLVNYACPDADATLRLHRLENTVKLL